MLRKKILVTCLVFGSIAIGLLGACSKADNTRSVNNGSADAVFGEDGTIDRKTFLVAYAECNGRVPSNQVIPCVTRVLDLKVDKYCAEKEMSPAHQKCVELHNKVKVQVAMNAMKNLDEAEATANAQKK